MTLQIIILLGSLALLIFGAEWIVDGSSAIARRAGLSEFLIGLTVVGIGTSMPELAVSTVGALKGSADISIGNVVGSNIFNVLLILGVTAMIRPVFISGSNLRRDIPLNIFVTVLLILFGKHASLFGLGEDTLSRLDGAIFLLLFIAYMYISFRTGKEEFSEDGADEDAGGKGKKLYVAILLTLAGFAALIAGGKYFVDSATKIARMAHLSEKFIAVTILAGGTSMPELVTCVVATVKKKGALALGNIIGSNISNILLILGTSALVFHPSGKGPSGLSFGNITWMDLGVLVLSSLLLLTSAWSGRNNKIGRGDATLFLLCQGAYLVWLFLNL